MPRMPVTHRQRSAGIARELRRQKDCRGKEAEGLNIFFYFLLGIFYKNAVKLLMTIEIFTALF